ncbi:hypothetical protein E2C01_056619 [Portunus trituberculatus]|uniref:Uncharacterized protein n=1 Tax=Portunus trituberculatus TaxID=210409 RepID=A0A5B7GXW8_PORTR|nr:hypothetical protein [Portunus trituberculatus]
MRYHSPACLVRQEKASVTALLVSDTANALDGPCPAGIENPTGQADRTSEATRTFAPMTNSHKVIAGMLDTCCSSET